jgi:hypothetical protein
LGAGRDGPGVRIFNILATASTVYVALLSTSPSLEREREGRREGNRSELHDVYSEE